MPIKDNIRKKVNAKLRKQTHLQYDYELYPKTYELHAFLKRSGYLLDNIVYHRDLDKVELIIRPKVKGYLHPDISHDMSDNKFYVRVDSYGLLEVSELENILKGYTTAAGVLSELSQLDLDGVKSEYLSDGR